MIILKVIIKMKENGGGLTISYNIGEYGSQSIGYRAESRNIIADDDALHLLKK